MKLKNSISIKINTNTFSNLMLKTSKDFFKFDNSFFEIHKEKVNFIYANNGVGKTTIYELITSDKYQLEESIKFIAFNPDKNTYLEKNDVISVSKNLGLIKEAEKQNKQIISDLNGSISEIKKNDQIKMRKGSKLWSNHFSPFLEKEGLDILKKIYDKSFKIEEENLEKFVNELKQSNKKDYSQKTSKFKIVENYKYNQILNCKNEIINNLEKIEEEAIKDMFAKNKIKQEWNLVGLKCIKDCLDNNLKNMSKCYICESDISDFNQIKEQISQKISILMMQENLEIRNYLNEFDNFFNEVDKVEDILDKLNETNAKEIKDKIIKTVNDRINDYFDMFWSWVKTLKEMFLITENENKIKKFIENNESIKKWKKDKQLSKEIKKEDFEIASEILTSVIGNNLNLNYQDDNFLSVSKIRNEQSNDQLPFSNGEKKLIRIILNLIFLVSNIENEEDKRELNKQLLVIDDTDDFFDELNKINIGYILNLFIREYKLGFVILTNKTNFIKELSYIVGNERINLILFYKDIDEKRVFKNAIINDKLNEMKFLNFKEGMGLLKTIINNDVKKMNFRDKTTLFLYFSWMYRVLIPLSIDKVEILKFSELKTKDEEQIKTIFQNSREAINNYFFNKEAKFTDSFLSFDEFWKDVSIFLEDINKIELTCFSNYMNSFIIQNNILNLVKILFIRENLKEKLDKFFENINIKSKYEDELNKGQYVFVLNELIWNKENIAVEINNEIQNKNIKKSLYLLNILDNFIHVEISPTLLLKGIELNKKIILSMNEEVNKMKFN